MRARSPGVVTGAATWFWSVVVVALVAGGCVAPTDEVAGAEAGDGQRAPAAVPNPAAAADPGLQPSVDAQQGPGLLRLVTVGAAATDPVDASPAHPADVAVVDLLYDGLTRWDDDRGTWVPDLAVSATRDRRARTWTFTLGDRRFSDGEQITSADVVASLERMRSTSTGVTDRLDHVETVRSIDSTTVEVVLNRADAGFAALLSHPLFGITPTADRGEHLDGRSSSGPMTVGADRTPLLVGNPWSPGVPGVEVEVVVVEDLLTGLALVASGAADVMHVPPSYEGVTDGSADSGVTVAYALHAGSQALGSAEVRRGLAAATDPALVAGVMPGLVPIENAVPGSAAASTELPTALSLAIVGAPAAGTADRGSTRPADAAAGTESALAGAIAAQWRAAGVDVRIRALTLDRFVTVVARGEHEAIRTGWVELYPGDRPQWRLVDPAGVTNVTGLADAALASAVRRARRTGDAEAIRAADGAFADAGALIPIGRLQVRIVTAPDHDQVTVGRGGSLQIGG